jgi:glyoxylase-like metal-dependent hydrolase (beta-lactamase superfamily II)
MKPNPAAPPPASPPDPAGYPVQTYAFDPANPGKVAVSLTLNGETVDVIPLGPGHTGGDSAVRFEKANVIMFGDVIRNFGGPFIDQGNGGSIEGAIATMDLLTKIADDNTTLAPGHGALMHKRDLVPLRAMFVDLLAKAGAMVKAGKSMDEFKAADLMKPYAASLPGYNQAAADRFVEELYYEAKGLPPLVNGRRAMPRAPG